MLVQPFERRFSYSQINQYMRCPYLWHTQYARGVQRREDPHALSLGSAVHVAIAEAIRIAHHGLSPLDMERRMATTVLQWQEAQREKALLNPPFNPAEWLLNLEQTAQEALNIAIRAVEYLDLSQWETIYLDDEPLIEKSLAVKVFDGSEGLGEVAGSIELHAIVDWVARHIPSNTVWLIDHKVRGQFTTEDADETNLQAAIYQHALLQRGIHAVGSMTFQIKNAVPKVPNLNKDGTMSRVKIMTDWDTYSTALVHAGLNPADYQDMHEKLKDAKFFAQTRAYRSLDEVRITWQNVVKTSVRDMLTTYFNAQLGGIPRRCMTHLHCSQCYMRLLCMEELRPNPDSETIIREMYATSAPSSVVLVD